ncbi:MAG: hypothetical protein AB7O97_12575 [Planctomycetota bacterium]
MRSDRESDAFEVLAAAAVRHIVEHEDFEQLCAWMRERLPESGLLPREADQATARALSWHLARNLWNSTPLPGNGLRPRPVPLPGSNDRCPCGAVAKWKRCCGRLPEVPQENLVPEDILPIVLESLPRSRREELLAQAGPARGLAFISALVEAERGRSKRAVQLLEPLVAGPLDPSSRELAMAADLLLDLYDGLGWGRKCERLASRCTEVSTPCDLRAIGWRWLAQQHHRQGDTAAAWRSLAQAKGSAPQLRGLALVEVQLLTAEGRVDEARRRGAQLQAELRRCGDDAAEHEAELLAVMLDEVERAAESDPEEGLRAWVEGLGQRPIPRYELSGIERRASRAVTGPAELRAPGPVRRLEPEWREVFPVEPPFGTLPAAAAEVEDCWTEGVLEDWVQFLVDEPAAADALDILDDVATALEAFDDTEPLRVAVLERAVAIVGRALAKAPHAELPWSILENRPALRAMARLRAACARRGDAARARELTRELLRRNPQDNQGLRSLEMESLLADGDDGEALALARRYADDFLVDIRFGHVLALFRTGDRVAAVAALRKLASDRPKVVRYLLAERIRKPRLRDDGFVQLGGEDEAWHYRENSRRLWSSTPGAIEWLRQTLADPDAAAGPAAE